jgi:hypothetical protein
MAQSGTIRGYFAAKGWLPPIDSARLAAWNVAGLAGLFPGNDPGQNNPEKNFVLNQLLMRSGQSHLRVICATPF